MKRQFKKSVLSLLLVFGLLACMVPSTLAAEELLPMISGLVWKEQAKTTESAPGSGSETETPHKILIPKASDIEHVHNSVGWNCSFECTIPEHVHTIEGGCYVKGDDLLCDYHEHTEACYNADGDLVCGKKSLTWHMHTTEECYELTCENTDADHVHKLDECYQLVCNQQESEGHEHSDLCYSTLICDKPEHTHNETDCQKKWVCETEYVLLTVEYYIAVNGQEVRAASTYQALLKNGDEYKAPIDDLRKDGYKIGVVKRYTAGQEDTPEEITVTKENSKYTVSGKMEKDTKIIVHYVYQEEYAPYRVDYWGYNAAGKDQTLLYSYTGLGKKDSQIGASQDEINTGTISVSVNELMKNLYDILGNQAALGDSGETFIQKLVQAVNAKYLTGDEEKKDAVYHDITPLLETIAGVGKEDDAETKAVKLNSLTRVQVKSYIAEKLVKVYGFDQESQQIWDAKLTVTADELAVRNLYYVPKKPQTVLFTTGLPNAVVAGIPKTPFDPEPDPDNVGLNYEIKLSTNYITSLPTVDISKYTDNIYGKHQSYIFVGWVTGEGAEVITDYTPANAAGKYKDITIYTASGDPADAGKPSLIPAGVKTESLADTLIKMPDGGATYYAVWSPFAASYTVQLWFESEKGDNTYIESHALDIHRYNEIGMPVTFNEFDVNRAKEENVINAANSATNVIFDTSVTFADTQSDTVDEYHTYADYQNSPFYGFDFLVCDVCAADATQCGSAGCTCGKQRKSNADGTEGEATSVTACNYQKVTVGENGTTVLNLYYTREIWEISLAYSVPLWTVQALQRANEFRIHIYWTGGQEQTEIEAAMALDKLYLENFPAAMEDRIIRGKYGTMVDDAHKNGIGWDGLGSAWQDLINEEYKSWTLPAGTKILLENGSEAFQPEGVYIYPQDTISYVDGTPTATPQDWVLPFHCLSTLEPEMFTNRTAKKNADDSGYVTIQNGVSMWEKQRFGEESSYDLSTNTHTYGTHRLDLYPYYHAMSDNEALASHTFNVNYYLQALPHEEAGAPYSYETKNKDQIKFVKDLPAGKDYTVTFDTPAELLSYNASTPDGFLPLMWRTSPMGFDAPGAFNRGGFQGKGVIDAAYRYTRPQVVLTGAGQYQVPTMYLSIVYQLSGKGDHNASFNQDNLVYLGGNTVYESDWRQQYTRNRPTQDSAAVARMDPGGYWITNWIRVGRPGDSTVQMNGSLTGANGLYSLIKQANQNNKEAQILLHQLESSFSAGAMYPSGENEAVYYHRNNANVYRYASAGQFNLEKTLENAENAVAFARNQYTITYNTCFLNEDGELLRDENGVVMVKLHETQYETGEDGVITGKGDMIYYDQPLGYDPNKGSDLATFDEFYNNYYDAYFALDGNKNPMDSDAFVFKGYGKPSDESLFGGYGRWYLDPDGTIPFNEENLKKMPAGNIDVYYHYNDFRYQIFFVDEISGKDKDPMDVVLNGEEKTLNAVINHQTVVPNTAAESFPDPSDENLYFAGWFYDEEGTNPYDFGMEINEDVVVYAVWKPKVPTEYKIRHVLVDQNGNEIREIVESQWEASYVGNTIDANALNSEYYVDGMYFKVDDYSQSMILEAQDEAKTKNILTFYYTYAGMRYTIEYKDIRSQVDILPPVTYATKLSAVTVGMTEISGWDYVGYSVDQGEVVPKKTHVTVKVTENGVVVTFWYERIPADDEIMALKLVDGVLSEGTRFHFELVDESGNVVRTAQSVNGIILFDSLELDTVGTYRYVLREVDESGEYRFDYDDTTYEVVVEITQPSITEPLACKITYYKNGELYDGTSPVFENHRLPAEMPWKAEKYLDGKLMSGDGFVFLLEGGDGVLDCGYHIHHDGCYELQLICGYEEGEEIPGEGEAPAEKHEHSNACYEKVLICGEDENADHTAHDQSCYIAPNTLIEEVTASDGSIPFSSLSFDHTGVYVYRIHERNDGGTSYLYDEGEYRVAVEVFINDRYELDKKITITRDGEPAEKVRFDNYTIIPAEVPLIAEKYLDGNLMSGDGFAFLLEGGEGILDCGYHIHSEGCYERQLICGYEEGEEIPREGEAPGEQHEHSDDCYGNVPVCGKEENADHTAHDQSCYKAPDTLIEEVSASNGSVVFKTLSFNQPGIYVYRIFERNDGGFSYWYDGAQYRIAVEVFFQDHQLHKKVTVTRDGEPVEKIRFDNLTIHPTDLQLTAQKYLDGNLMSGDGFAFLLEGGEGVFNCDYHVHEESCYERQLICGYEEGGQTLEEGENPGDTHEHSDDCYGDVLVCGEEENADHTAHDQSCYKAPDTQIEEVSASNGAIVFRPLSFDHPGVYVYHIYERNDGDAGYRYDEALYRVAVEVFINEREDFERKVTITRDGEPVENIRFDNETIPPDEPVIPPDEPVIPPDEPVIPPDEPVTPPDEPVTPPVQEIPPTDDSVPLYWYMLLMLISGVGLTTLSIRKYRMRRR